MGEQRVHAGPACEDLDGRDAARRGVAVVGGGDVTADLAGPSTQGAKPEHGRTIAVCAFSSCTDGRVRVPNIGRPGWPVACGPRATTSSTPSFRRATSRAPIAGGWPSGPS